MFEPAAVTAAIAFLTQISKSFIPEKFVRLVPVVLGVMYTTARMGMIHADVVLYGVLLGAASMGAYDMAHLDVPNKVKTPVVNTFNKVKSMIK